MLSLSPTIKMKFYMTVLRKIHYACMMVLHECQALELGIRMNVDHRSFLSSVCACVCVARFKRLTCNASARKWKILHFLRRRWRLRLRRGFSHLCLLLLACACICVASFLLLRGLQNRIPSNCTERDTIKHLRQVDVARTCFD